MQSIVDEKAAAFHVAIIMDGNGRWATRRGLPRSAGHQAGVRAARLVTKRRRISASRPSHYLHSRPTTGDDRARK